jgi:hypothetical protein
MASHLVTQVSSSKTPSIYLVMCIKDTINQLEMKKLQFSIRRYTALHPIRPKTDSYSGHLGVTLCTLQVDCNISQEQAPSKFSIIEHGVKCGQVIQKVVIHVTGEGEVIFQS